MEVTRHQKSGRSFCTSNSNGDHYNVSKRLLQNEIQTYYLIRASWLIDRQNPIQRKSQQVSNGWSKIHSTFESERLLNE